MPDGLSIIAPSLATAHGFWGTFTGDPNTVIRLRLIYEAGEERLPKDLSGNFLDPVTNEVLPVNPKNGKPRKPNTHEREGQLDALWPEVVKLQELGFACFYFPNVIKPGTASGYGGTATDNDVERVRAVFIDCDNELPADWHIAPSIIVETSQGRGQALWRTDDLLLDEFSEAQQRLAAHYGTDATVKNPSRVLRLPGSLHQKRTPQLVTFEDREAWEGPRQSSSLLAGLPPVERVERKTEVPPGYAADNERVLDYARKEIKRWVQRGDVPVDGNRNVMVNKLAMRLHGIGLSQEMAVAYINAFYIPHGQAPDEPITDIVTSSYKSAARVGNAPGSELPLTAEEKYGDALDAVLRQSRQASWERKPEDEIAKRRAKFRARKPSELMRRPAPRYWDKEKLFVRIKGGGASMITASYSNAKTTFTTCRTIAIAREHGVRVLYICGEAQGGFGPKTLQAATKGWNDHHPDNPITEAWLDDHFKVVEVAPQLMDDGDVAAVIAEHKEWNPDLVIIDTLGCALAGKNLNASEVGTGAGESLKAITRELNADLWVIHHLGKDESQGATGTIYFLNNPEMALTLKFEKRAKRLLAKVTKDRWGNQQGETVVFGAETIHGLKVYDDYGNVASENGEYLYVYPLKPDDPRHKDEEPIEEHIQRNRETALVQRVEDVLFRHKDYVASDNLALYLTAVERDKGETDEDYKRRLKRGRAILQTGRARRRRATKPTKGTRAASCERIKLLIRTVCRLLRRGSASVICSAR